MTLLFCPINLAVSRLSTTAVLFFQMMFGAIWASAQARQELKYDFLPSQLTGLYQRTLDDYTVQNSNGSPTRVELNGGVGEYAYRRFYPFEIVSRVSCGLGQPLGQHLMSFTAGGGYTRQLRRRYYPFGRVTAGFVHTSSTSDQYLYGSGSSGFAFNTAGGVDIGVIRHYGVRAIEFENQYLPFGVNNHRSVYWSFGVGAYYRFGK